MARIQESKQPWWKTIQYRERKWQYKRDHRRPEKDRRMATKEYYARHPGKLRERSLKYLYGMSLLAFDRLWLKQGGECAICSISFGECRRGGGVQVDHSHLTGEVRGLLCERCNRMLGHAKDNPEVVERAAVYLRTGGVPLQG